MFPSNHWPQMIQIPMFLHIAEFVDIIYIHKGKPIGFYIKTTIRKMARFLWLHTRDSRYLRFRHWTLSGVNFKFLSQKQL